MTRRQGDNSWKAHSVFEGSAVLPGDLCLLAVGI